MLRASYKVASWGFDLSILLVFSPRSSITSCLSREMLQPININRPLLWLLMFRLPSCGPMNVFSCRRSRVATTRDQHFARRPLAEVFRPFRLTSLRMFSETIAASRLQFLSSSRRVRLGFSMNTLSIVDQHSGWIKSDWRVSELGFMLAMKKVDLHTKDAREQCQEASNGFHDRLYTVEERPSKCWSAKIFHHKQSPHEQSLG